MPQTRTGSLHFSLSLIILTGLFAEAKARKTNRQSWLLIEGLKEGAVLGESRANRKLGRAVNLMQNPIRGYAQRISMEAGLRSSPRLRRCI